MAWGELLGEWPGEWELDTEDALRPCLFCGSADYISLRRMDSRPDRWQFWCKDPGYKCNASGPWRPSIAEAVAAWNRRAADTFLEALA